MWLKTKMGDNDTVKAKHSQMVGVYHKDCSVMLYTLARALSIDVV